MTREKREMYKKNITQPDMIDTRASKSKRVEHQKVSDIQIVKKSRVLEIIKYTDSLRKIKVVQK